MMPLVIKGFEQLSS